MPSNLTSSFASAAAGQAQNGNRGASVGGDWTSRRDGRSLNGTRTFRRSTTTSTSATGTTSAALTATTQTPGPTLDQSDPPTSSTPPTSNNPATAYSSEYDYGTSAAAAGPARYTREEIINVYRGVDPGSTFSESAAQALFMEGWAPGHLSSGTISAARQWGKSNEGQGNNEPDMCWTVGTLEGFKPLGLQDMTADEKEVFANDVNSPLKLNVVNNNANSNSSSNSINNNGSNAVKDASGTITNSRKISANHSVSALGNTNNSFGLSSPTTVRPPPRRRESTDYFGSSALNSPQTARFPRDDQSWLGARSKMAELRESSTADAGDDDAQDPPVPQSAREPPKMGMGFFGMPPGGSKQSNIVGGGGTSLGQGPSGWPATPSGHNTPSIGGAFGSFALPGAAIGGGSTKPTGNQSRLAHLLPGVNKDADVGGALLAGGSKAGTPGPDANDTARTWRRPRTDTDPFSESGRMVQGGASLIGSGGGRHEDNPPMPTPMRAATQPFETPHKSSTGVGLGLGDMGMIALHLDGLDTNNFSPSVTNPYRSPAQGGNEKLGGGGGDGSEENGVSVSLGGGGSGGSLQNSHDEFSGAANNILDRQMSAGSVIGSGGPSGLGGPFDQSLSGSGFGGSRGGFSGPDGGFDSGDRSQTSSVGAKGYPGLGGIGGGWPGAPGVSTPGGSNFGAPFGSVFSPIEIQGSPFGGNVFGQSSQGPGPGAIGTPSIGRRSKLEALFPPNMQQQQMQMQQNVEHEENELRQGTPGSSGLNSIGRGFGGLGGRDTIDSPINPRSLHDLFAPPVASPAGVHGMFGHDGGPLIGASVSSAPSGFGGLGNGSAGIDRQPQQPQQQPQQPSGANTSRQMVMPDRMRWVYLDPSGQVQGPFTGLEMNDWYKANFFSPDLSVRRLEDTEFEALGSLIRRIGNSREPFLVPQIGIPHGSPQPGPFGQNSAGGVVPPLSSVIPAYGRTLTAEEQNNLERRKQEEQFVAAQQRDIFIRQQHSMSSKFGAYPGALPGVMPVSLGGPLGGGIPAVHGLHHHSSAHSLHQPGFGGIPPIGAPHGPLGGLGSFLDLNNNLGPVGPSLNSPGPGPIGMGVGLQQQQQQQLIGEDLEQLNRLNSPFSNVGVPGAEAGFGQQQQQQQQNLPSAIAPPLAAVHESVQIGARDNLPVVADLKQDSAGFKDRLEEYNKLRKDLREEEKEQAQARSGTPNIEAEAKQEAVSQSEAVCSGVQSLVTAKKGSEGTSAIATPESKTVAPAFAQTSTPAMATQTLTKATSRPVSRKATYATQRQASPATAPAASAKETAKAPEQDSGLPMPFPPPANAASPEPLATLTPAQPPPTAPWAVEANTTRKVSSLKEIQEAEAVKAAKAEKAAAAARRAALEQEMLDSRERERAIAAAQSGLPTTSTWGQTTTSPVATVSSPWAKPVSRAATGTPAAKSSNIAEIQREEEAHKAAKAKELAKQQAAPVVGIPALGGAGATSASSTTGASTGKRYADLASKNIGPSASSSLILSTAAVGSSSGVSTISAGSNAASSGSPAASGWATVGAGGKIKAPATPVAAASVRSVSTVSSKSIAAKPATVTKANSIPGSGGKSDMQLAQEEFNKWIHYELRDLDKSIDMQQFISTLKEIGSEKGVIEDAIYSSSSTIDGRHFAEEFVRRKKLADRGIAEKIGAPIVTPAASGWSEVAKKGSHNHSHNHSGHASAAGSSSGGLDAGMVAGATFKVVPSRKKNGKK